MNHDPARLAEIRSLAGISTPKPRVADQLTAMQAVSYVAGEPLSERPACTDRLLAPFVSSWGEDLDDVERNALLLPLVPELVGAHRGPAQFFGNLALAWMLRDALPAWLRVAGHKQTERFEAQLPAPVSPAAIEAWTFEVEALGRFLPYTLGQDFGDELVGVELTRQVLPLLRSTGEGSASIAVEFAFGLGSPVANLADRTVTLCQVVACLGCARAAKTAIAAAWERDRERAAAAAVKATYEPVRIERQASALALVRRMTGRVQ